MQSSDGEKDRKQEPQGPLSYTCLAEMCGMLLFFDRGTLSDDREHTDEREGKLAGIALV